MSDLARFVSTFEGMASENGALAWHEDDLMGALGYTDRGAFRKVVIRAMQACLTLNIDPTMDFIRVGSDYKFTRFACYLIAMNGDAKKPQVAMVQIYLGSFASSVYDHSEQAEIVDRVLVREEMKEGLKSLAATAHDHGVRNYARFMNAGYRGMYNRGLREIEKLKGVAPREHLIDRMGRTELAANLFRVALTDNKIQQEEVHGQLGLEHAAFEVGQVVRDAVIRAGGQRPEDLPLAKHIKEAKKTLKAAGTRLKQVGAEEAEAEITYLSAVPERDPGYTRDPEEDEPDHESDYPPSR